MLTPCRPDTPPPLASAAGQRHTWVAMLDRLARPVLESLAQRRLRERMPVEAEDPEDRRKYTHLEAVGRLLAGIAPWLETGSDDEAEGELRRTYLELTHASLAAATDPDSPDALNFTEGSQPLVDAAFLAQAFLRAPHAVWARLDPAVQRRLIDSLLATRVVHPPFNNWLLFAATIEAFFAQVGVPWDRMRVDYALRQVDQWYVGDGHYRDGAHFHADYYNSYVIQPMLLDVLAAVVEAPPEIPAWRALQPLMLRRAQRYAEVQERSVAPDGTFPAIGRSITYRCGAFQTLALLALRRDLPDSLAPGDVREALSAVIARTLGAPGTFDDAGWLRIGLCGHQPALSEPYISTGSLYLCASAFLPLGLPSNDRFWREPGTWSARRVWAGAEVAADHSCD